MRDRQKLTSVCAEEAGMNTSHWWFCALSVSWQIFPNTCVDIETTHIVFQTRLLYERILSDVTQQQLPMMSYPGKSEFSVYQPMTTSIALLDRWSPCGRRRDSSNWVVLLRRGVLPCPSPRFSDTTEPEWVGDCHLPTKMKHRNTPSKSWWAIIGYDGIASGLGTEIADQK